MDFTLDELKETIVATLSIEVETDELESLTDLMYRQNDFTIEIGNQEYRFINDDCIWDIYRDEQEELIKDCYLGGVEIPYWLEIDWEKTCENVLSADGYGHHFSHYDHSEEQITYNEEVWYIFRTN